MSIKAVLIGLLTLCLMIGCVAGAEGSEDDEDIIVDIIDPIVPFNPIDPGSENVGQQIADYIKELLENLFGGGRRPPFLTE
jgi:hypothetical protein